MGDQTRQRILYIEDDNATAMLFKTVMEDKGFAVDLAESGEQGLSLFHAETYHLVAVDYELGSMSGINVCRELVKIDTDLPLILVTGKGNEEIVAEAMEIGVARYIPKLDDTTYTDVFPVVIHDLLKRRENARKKIFSESMHRQIEERFRLTEELSASCHWEADKIQSEWTYTSANTEHLLGIPINDLLGNYEIYLQHIHSGDQDWVRAAYTKASQDQGSYQIRYRFCRPDGKIIHLLEHAVPVTDENGEILRYHGSTQDITAQVDTEERFRAVVENAVEAIITIDSGGIIQSFNQSAESLFQFSADETIGQNVSMLMQDEHAEQHDEYLSRYLTTREARIIGVGREVEGQRKDGTTFPAYLSVSQHEVGGKISFTGLLSDISEQKTAEIALIQAKNEAERANRAKSEFLSSMSHELRTPLNAILGFAQMLEYNPKELLSDTQQESVNLIKRGGDHLLNLINEVLELAKIESGRIDLSIETIDLSKAIDECTAIARATANPRGIELTNSTESIQLPNIEADMTRFKQVLLNLLSNSVKYNRDAGHVTIEAGEISGDFVRISVIDTGIGLSEREKKKIFEPFERLGKQTESVQGTGIGLTITKQLIELMHGRIGFESEAGKGSTFWIELPKSYHVEGQNIKDIEEASRKIATGPIADPNASYSVIYIEDNRTNALLMERIFDAIPNAELKIFETARDGIKHAKTDQPDVVLMDINLPGMDGIEATKILQRNTATKHIPVIAISASIWRARNGIEEEVDFFQYVEKPFDVIEIREIIQAALGGGSE